MRTKVLLIIKIYYLTFILATLCLTLATGYTNFEFLSQAPILFLLHGNINEVALSFIKNNKSLSVIFYVVWLIIYQEVKYHATNLVVLVYAINTLKLLSNFISGIFHPPKYLKHKKY